MEAADTRIRQHALNPAPPDATLDDRPYRALWASVLAQAIADLASGQYPMLKHWFTSEESRAPSFVFVCGVLDLNAARMRAQVLARARAHQARA